MDWKELFGSDDEEEEENRVITFKEIPGLSLIKQGLNHNEQMTLTNQLINNNYFSQAINQAMCFGTLPPYIQWLSDWVMEKYPHLFSEEIMKREPLFDQAILNLYKKGEGICSHVDLLRFLFEDGILIVSLLSSCVMSMRPTVTADTIPSSYHSSKNQQQAIPVKEIDILLCPGDILALSGDARYKWEHGIKEQLYDNYHDEIIERGTRISVTLRKLMHDNLGTINKTEMTQTVR